MADRASEVMDTGEDGVRLISQAMDQAVTKPAQVDHGVSMQLCPRSGTLLDPPFMSMSLFYRKLAHQLVGQ